jgi:hypothetical protein
MHAYTGNWTISHYIATERVRLAADRKRAADNRRKHRSLDRRERLLADLEAVDKRLRALRRLQKQNPGVEYRVIRASNGEVAIVPVEHTPPAPQE